MISRIGNNTVRGVSGLTLIELLVSVAILADAVVLVMQALARSAYALALVQNRLTVYAFSSTKMAELELSLKQGIAPAPRGHFLVGRETFDWHVDTAPSAQDPQLELVTLTVDWHQGPRTYNSHVTAISPATTMNQKP